MADVPKQLDEGWPESVEEHVTSLKMMQMISRKEIEMLCQI